MLKLDGRFCRLMCLLVCAVMLVGLLPAALADDAKVYGRIIKDEVAFRNTASSSGFVKFRMPLNTIVEVTKDKGSTSWYGIKATEPGQNYESSGYCAANCLEVMTAAEVELWLQAGAPATFAPSAVVPGGGEEEEEAGGSEVQILGYVTMLDEYNEANLRDDIDGDVAAKWKRAEHSVLPYVEHYTDVNWYKVLYEDSYLYVNGTVVNECSEDGGEKVLGYVTIIDAYKVEGVNLRDGVNGDVDRVWYLSAYKALPYIEKPNENWYKVRYGEDILYVKAEVVLECNADGEVGGDGEEDDKEEEGSGDITDSYDGMGGYVTIRSGYKSVNLRQSAGGTYRGIWLKSQYKVLPYVGIPVYHNGYNWYAVMYGEKEYYVTGQFVAECDKDGNLIASGSGSGSSATPTPAPESGSSTGSVRLIEDKVIFRKSPGGDMIRRLDKGTVMPLDGYKTSGGYKWYRAQASDGKWGYIREDMCTVINGTYTEDGVIVGYLKLVKTGVNLRKSPAGSFLQRLANDLTLPILDDIGGEGSGSYTWYKVKAPDGTIGYVRSDCIEITETTGTSDPSATPSPSSGYVMITDNKVKFRKSAAGTFIKFLNKNEVYPLVGAAIEKSDYYWYPIKVDNTVGYVRDDFSVVLNDAQVEAYLKGDPIPEATPTPTGSLASSYIITTDSVNLRESTSTDSTKLFEVEEGTVMGYSTKQTVGGEEWYKGVYKNKNIWVMGKYVKVMTNDEYEAWLDANPDAEKPTTEVISGYVKTTDTGINLRSAPGGTIITRIAKGTVMAYSGAEYLGNDVWFYVKSPSNGYGYIVEDYLVITDKSGNKLPEATPDITVNAGGGSSSGEKQEASYTTLRKGATGDDVKAMVAELKNQGYWTGDVISTYNSDVVNAVKKFQTDNYLDVDGVAGPNTLHALYGTVPVGTNNGMPTMNIYPVEKIDWWTGGIQKLWPKGKNVVVMDVKTGYTFWAHRWSGGNHVDAEPLTASDTATICKMYGVSTADQIESKNLWQRRPLWVTIGNRTFAASMFGFPHNYPDGDTISTNNFKGQFCIHFTNSTIHRTDLICDYHQAAINEAYKKAPSRK